MPLCWKYDLLSLIRDRIIDCMKDIIFLDHLKKYIYQHYDITVIVIFLIAFLLRLLFCWYYPSIPPDSIGYYTAAINIANGNGYSACIEPPFEPYYFREPLTSYSFAIVIWLYKFFHHIDVIEYPVSWNPSEMQPVHQHIIFGVRVLFILLQLTAIYIFSLIVRKKSNKKCSLIFLLICALYFPLIANTTQPLREPFVFFILSIIGYCWVNYLVSSKAIYIIFIAFLNGSLCLFLQSYWVLACFILLFMLIYNRRKLKVLFRHAILFLFFMSLPLAPHVYRVYQYYPDLRIVRTLGSALTFEYTKAMDAYRAFGASPWSVKDGDLPNNMKTHAEYFNSSAYKIFERSFDGTFQREAERLNAANTKENIFHYYFDNYLLNLRNTIFMVGITYDYGVFCGNCSIKDVAKFFFVLPYLLFGLFAVLGLWPFLKKYWLLMPIFFYHSMLFFIYGSEERRQVMLIPYIICIVMFVMYQYYSKNKAKNENIGHLPDL